MRRIHTASISEEMKAMQIGYRYSFLLLLGLSAVGLTTFGRISPNGANALAADPAPTAVPAVPVSVAPASRADVPVFLTGLGAVQAYNSVTIRPQVDGQLKQISFTEGQEVHAGDLLAQIDPRSFQAALDQALAKKAQDQAQLANARADVQRYAGLVDRQFVARQQLDNARALAAQLEAAIQGDEAAIESARVTLGYTNIKSPIDGRAGIRQIDQGNIVHASDQTGIVVISQMHPISVIFTLPEDAVQRVNKAMSAGPLKVQALSRDGKQNLGEGALALVDNQIDQSTGTVRLKANLPNTDGSLWPGQFVNARLMVETRKQVLTVPASAILRGQQGAYAYVAKGDGTVEARPLTVGFSNETLAVIDSGLNDGDVVVTSGQYRLQQGAHIQIKPAGDTAAKAE
jgi:multidrug efflux system membrane fusion protein